MVLQWVASSVCHEGARARRFDGQPNRAETIPRVCNWERYRCKPTGANCRSVRAALDAVDKFSVVVEVCSDAMLCNPFISPRQVDATLIETSHEVSDVIWLHSIV